MTLSGEKVEKRVLVDVVISQLMNQGLIKPGDKLTQYTELHVRTVWSIADSENRRCSRLNESS